jgi:site-specific recombinase XerC
MKSMRTRAGEGQLFRTRKSKEGPEVGSYGFWFKGKRYNTGTQDYDEALGKLAAWLPRLRKGLSIGEGKTATIRDLLALVEEDYQRKRRRTKDRLGSRLKRLRAELGSLPAPVLTTERVESYIVMLQDQGLKNATINRDLESLRRAFRLAAKRRPPMVTSELAIELLPQNNERNVDLTMEEYRALLEFLAQRDRAVRLMTVIAYHIGWRAEPIRSLRKLQVDFESMLIRTPAAQAENKKVGSAPIYGDLERELRIAFSFDEANFGATPWVIHRAGKPLKTYRTAWEEARVFIGRPDLRFHDLRGVAESNMLEAGLDESYVMHVIGHTTRSSLDRYRRVSQQRNDRARVKLEEFQKSQTSSQKILGRPN